jgi:hypothetical protein
MSPFLEGTRIQYAWDSTSLSWLKACPRQYYYNMIEGWLPKGQSDDITFGQIYHSCLEYYDKIKATSEHFDYEATVRATVRKAYELTEGWKTEHTSKNPGTLVRAIIWYLDEFKNDTLTTHILPGGRPAIELSFRFNLEWGPKSSEQPYVLCGHLDRIVDFSDMQFVTDRKTTGHTISSDYFGRFDLDNQMSTYTVAAGVVFKTPVKGVIIDACQTAVGFNRFARGMTYRTPAQTEEWLNDLRYWLGQAEMFALANYWPMNEKSCFLCHYKRVCSKDPGVRQMFLESDYERREWNPLQPR